MDIQYLENKVVAHFQLACSLTLSVMQYNADSESLQSSRMALQKMWEYSGEEGMESSILQSSFYSRYFGYNPIAPTLVKKAQYP